MALKQEMSLEAFLALPEEKPYQEYLFGQVISKAMPKLPHGLLQARLAHLLSIWTDAGAGGVVATELRCILTTPSERHVQLPDVSWFARKPSRDQNGHATSPPDVAIEVLSPDDPFARVDRKVRVYLEAGVKLVWLVDTTERTILVYRKSQEPELLEGDAVVSDPILPGFEYTLSGVFKPLDSIEA